MMDYCARESTLDAVDVSESERLISVSEREMSTSEIVREVRKELMETISVLSSIRLSLEGTEATEKKVEEPKCFHEEVKVIERMATDCMGLSHLIAERLFGSFH